jgi:hypothetical protein
MYSTRTFVPPLSSHFELSSVALAPSWGAPGATDASQWSIASTVNRQSLPTRNAGNSFLFSIL